MELDCYTTVLEFVLQLFCKNGQSGEIKAHTQKIPWALAYTCTLSVFFSARHAISRKQKAADLTPELHTAQRSRSKRSDRWQLCATILQEVLITEAGGRDIKHDRRIQIFKRPEQGEDSCWNLTFKQVTGE